MSNGWSGPDPVAFQDVGSAYELGTRYHANGDITINSVRVWGGPTSVAQPNRKARIWLAGGVQLTTATLPDQLLPGWNTYPVVVSQTITNGTVFWVTYSVNETYGAAIGQAYPVASASGLVTAESGGLNGTPGAFPNTFNTSFYGVDIDFVASVAGNVRPTVGITTATTGYLTAAATLTIQDETPASVTYVIEWGDGTSSSVTTLGPHTHTYAAAGTYAVMVTATDIGGLTDSAATVVTVVAAPGILAPNSEIVARAWLATIPGITAGMVSTNLPRDNATWAASGFVQVSGVVGGGMDMDTGMNNPVISLDLWGATGGSALPPWGKVARLGRLIMDSCVGSVADHVLLNLGTKYAQARVTDAIARTEPRRVPGDKSGYAHYTIDLQLSWVKV